MNAKRLTALALAALMATSTMSVAFADVGEDQVLDFFPKGTSYRDQLYMEDEDGLIVAAEDGDFAPGDDIYIQLEEYRNASSSDLKKIDAWADWDIGKSWVDDVEVVYDKGTYITGAAKEYQYTINGFTGDYTNLNGSTIKTNKTEQSSILDLARKAITQDQIDKAVTEVAKKYTETVWHFNGTPEANKEAAEAKAKALVETISGYKINGGNWLEGKISDNANYETSSKSVWHYSHDNVEIDFATLADALKKAGWTEAVTDGSVTYYTTADTNATEGKLVSSDTDGARELTDLANVRISGDATTGLWSNVTAQEQTLDPAISQKPAAAAEVTYEKTTGQVVTVTTENRFKYGNNEAVEKKETAEAQAISDKVTSESKQSADATAKAKIDVENAIKNMPFSYLVQSEVTRSGNPTGNYDGYTTTTGYTYWVKISTNKSATTKDVDIVGDIHVGRTKSAANKTDGLTLGVTLTNNDPNNDDFDEVDSDAYIEPGQRAVLSFADDATDVSIEFGDDALFEFNARGQGKLNFAYNTKYNKEFASDYESANIDFINFEGEPTTNRTGTLYIYVDEDEKGYIYEVTDKGAKKINGAEYDYDEQAWVIRTRHLTSYALSDKKLKTVDQMSSGSSSSGSTGGSTSGSSNSGSGSNGGKYNPDTGR